MIDFFSIEYLKNGNKKQQKTYQLLTTKHVFSVLSGFEPVLVGTIPINIDIENSDIDIICYWKKKHLFKQKILKYFGIEKNFKIDEYFIDNNETVFASFKIDNFEIEIFGQNIPTKHQNGFRHMIIEYHILNENDENFRNEIKKLKQQGYKTEPAFAFLLGLKNNPYTELLEFGKKYETQQKTVNK